VSGLSGSAYAISGCGGAEKSFGKAERAVGGVWKWADGSLAKDIIASASRGAGSEA